MKALILITLLVCAVSVDACIISPYHMTVTQSEEIRDKSDVVFFGKLSKLDTNKSGEQTAVFTIIKSYKGSLSGDVVIKNRFLSSSCSRPFRTIGSAYYVFALKTDDPGIYKIPSSATFVPLESAIESGWDLH